MNGQPTRLAQRTWLVLALVVGVRLVSDALRLLRNPNMFTHSEEGYNAAVALAIGNAGMWDETLNLQYRAFCGGCTAVALAGAPILAVAGDHWLAWKATAMLWGAATLIAAWVAVDRWAGRPAAWATAMLLALPIPGLQDVSLYLWGNHQETNLLILTSLALLPGAPLVAGIVAGASLWFCKIAAYGLLGIVALGLITGRGWRARVKLVGGVGLGLLTFLLPVAQDYAQYNLRTREMAPVLQGGRGLDRVGELLGAASSFVPAFKAPGAPYAIGAVAVLLAAVVILAHARTHPRRAALLGFPLAFALGWAVSPYFIVPGSGVMSARYYTPWWMWWTVTVGVATGLLWERRGRWRWLAALLVLPLPLVSVWVTLSRPIGLVHGIRAGVPRALGLEASSASTFAHVAVARLDSERLGRARARDPGFDATLRRMEGVALGLDVRRGERTHEAALALATDHGLEVVRGLGTGLVGEEWKPETIGRANQWLEGLEPEVARALGYGIGGGLAPSQLRMARFPEALDPHEVHALLTTGATGTCHLCSAQGWLAVAACGGNRAEAECVVAWLLEPGRDATLEGIGSAVSDLPRPELVLERLEGALGAEDMALVELGATHPIYELNAGIRAPRSEDPLAP